MEHLPLPRDPCIGSLPIPYLLTEHYDGREFLTYPDRVGWNVTSHDWPDTLRRNGKAITSEHEIGAFLQTWLYFGLLHGITDEVIDPASFRIVGRTRGSSYLSSVSLSRIVHKWATTAITAEYEQDHDLVRRLGEDAQYLGDPINTWVENKQHILEVANYVWERISWAYGDNPGTLLSKICLSIGALGDYLGQTLSTIARERGVDDDFGRTMFLLPRGFCEPIVTRMQGWCPNRLYSFVDAQSFTAGALWYLANLLPPDVSDNHKACTPERCESLQIDPTKYRTKHMSPGCHCDFAGPSVEALDSIVEGNEIAVFSLGKGHNANVVEVRGVQDVQNYIAISHVWADGNGNLQENSLPLCTLRQIQRHVDKLGIPKLADSSTSIWMDTICLPRHPISARRKAISRLNEVFSKASGVLVIDSYLLRFSSADITTLEILARISICGWTARLWTFSEGQLARRLWVQFKDKAVDLFELTADWHEELRVQATRYDPSTNVSYHIASLYSATTLLRQRDRVDDQMQVFEMKAALTSRQTSWQRDEALCLGAVLDFDLSKIQNATDHGQMAAFWQQFKEVPADIVFTPISARLDTPGCRWAPVTLLGGENGELAMMNLNNPFQNAQPSANGLSMHLEGIVWDPTHQSSDITYKRNLINLSRGQIASNRSDHPTLLLQDQQGQWYRYGFINAWHQSPIEPDFSIDQPAIMLLVESHIESTFNQEDLSDEIRGIFVTSHQTDKTVPSKAHAHCTIHILPPTEGRIFDEIAHHAQTLTSRFSHKSADSAPDVDRRLVSIEVSLRGSRDTQRFRKRLAKLADVLQLAGGADAAFEHYLNYIRYFCMVGDWYRVQCSSEPRDWIVD